MVIVFNWKLIPFKPLHRIRADVARLIIEAEELERERADFCLTPSLFAAMQVCN